MIRPLTKICVLAALLLVTRSGESTQQTETNLLDLVRQTRAARLKNDYRAWLDGAAKALALAPDHPDLLISAARANAALGNESEALRCLREAVERGAGLDLNTLPEFTGLTKSPGFEDIAACAKTNLAPVARGKIFALVPDKTADSEGIAYDSAGRRLFVGTVHGEVLQINASGNTRPFVKGSGLREVYGLKVDWKRQLLWAVTGIFPNLFADGPQKADVGIGGVHAYRLNSGELVEKFWFDERPILHGFNDLAVAQNGDVYVTDSATTAVYRLRSGEKKFEVFIRDARMPLPNGIALTPDDKNLYVAHIEGITLIEVATRKVQKLAVPMNASVNSIDGLAYRKGALVGVQNSPYLARVVQIELSPDGRSVERVVILNSRTPAEYNQTTLAVSDDSLYVVGGAPAVDAKGTPLAPEPRPQVVRIPFR
jgi:DNA-binding beta-propeller fold protein YncE